MSEQTERGRSATRFGYTVAGVGLVLAVVLGWALMGIGSRRLKEAERVRTAAESQLLIALDFAADAAMERAQQARLSINKNNWGEAQTTLARMTELLTLMEQVAPERKRNEVSQVRQQLEEAQQLAGEKSPNALATLDALATNLDALKQQAGG